MANYLAVRYHGRGIFRADATVVFFIFILQPLVSIVSNLGVGKGAGFIGFSVPRYFLHLHSR